MKRGSPEQIAATAERRERFRVLARKVGSMSEEERAAVAARLPLVTVEGHALSVRNACLVAFQRADATMVGGFRQWKAAGRMVRKGEHGVQIWIPTTPKADPNRQPGELSSADDDGPGFIIGTVFDVSQTEEATAS